ncbi:MAG: NAD(P)/FAD-dependent oxidoreductase [Candidatus Omnitrophica bacterium]|nr:NAD(P)/FAD-dependent oxidoreductase [Candidatus Omnitrophota bacterium]
MSKHIHDTIIVGAGAAGLMCAVQARRLGVKVLLLDGQSKIGAKILMSGGTRCNVTNQTVTPHDYESETINIVRNILRAFPPEKTIKFFQDLGVEFILENGGKYFPSTHSGKTILEVLLKALKREGVVLETSRKVQKINFCNGVFRVSGQGFQYFARTVVLATGGLSYPQTGSDGVGYSVAQSFGHTLIKTSPALTPLQTNEPLWKSLKGIALSVKITLWNNNKKILEKHGDFLFTHFGFSGPVILDISRHWLRIKDKNEAKILVDFLPVENNSIAVQLTGEQKKLKKSIKNFLVGKLPERFVEAILTSGEIDFKKAANQITKSERELINKLIHHFELPISGAVGYSKAEVTAGGIDLREIYAQNLESRKQPGLFFAGEILDVDGRIGGFNFQWAWASGAIVARGIKNKVEKKVCDV